MTSRGPGGGHADKRTDSGRLWPRKHHMMGPLQGFAVCMSLLAAVQGFPADAEKPVDSDPNRVGLERPSTETPPKVSECGLDSLLSEVFGSTGDSDCGGNPNQPNPPPIPDQPYNNPYPETSPQPNPQPGYQPDPQPNPQPGYQPDPQPNPQPGYQPDPQPNPQPGGNGDCTCVPYYLCNDNNTINDNGIGLIDIRIKDDECDNYLQTCCGGANVRPAIDPITPPPPVQASSKCGTRNFEGVGFRITGNNDNEAQYGEFPWMVAIVRPDPSLSTANKKVNVYQCGGSLIHPQVVLTAAHCVNGKDNLVIRAGEWDTQTKNELFPTQDRNVRQVIVHEKFHNGTLANDPALLILDTPVDMSVENVGLVCLPEANEIMDGRECVASGWGKDLFGKEGKYQVILKRVDLPVVPRARCLEDLRKTRLGAKFKLDQSFMCAGGISGRDTCKGDGGSPLACPSKKNPSMYVQAGIVAWGIDCGKEVPGVYVNVPFFINWIYNKLQAQGISIDS